MPYTKTGKKKKNPTKKDWANYKAGKNKPTGRGLAGQMLTNYKVSKAKSKAVAAYKAKKKPRKRK